MQGRNSTRNAARGLHEGALGDSRGRGEGRLGAAARVEGVGELAREAAGRGEGRLELGHAPQARQRVTYGMSARGG